MNSFKVSNLMVNYRKNPLGIDDFHPRLSWQIISETRGFVQTAYQAQVAYNADFTTEI